MGTPAQLILVDSDILIDASRQDAAAVDWLDQRRPEIAVSTITHIELLSGCRDKREWLLETHAQLRTADLPGAIAGKAGIAPGRDGRYQAGLHAAWMLVAAHVGGAPAAFVSAQESALLDHMQRRNRSILAHGFAPIDAADWRAFQAWLETAFIPMLQGSLQQAGLRSVFPQLPDIYPWDRDNAC